METQHSNDPENLDIVTLFNKSFIKLYSITKVPHSATWLLTEVVVKEDHSQENKNQSDLLLEKFQRYANNFDCEDISFLVSYKNQKAGEIIISASERVMKEFLLKMLHPNPLPPRKHSQN